MTISHADATAANEKKLAAEGIIRPEIGDVAPDFTTTDIDGGTFALHTALEKGYVLLFFYPVNDAPNAAKNLLALSKADAKLRESHVYSYAVNPSTHDEGMAFFSKYSIGLPLLDDASRLIAQRYGCAGANSTFVQRTVVVIGKDGKIAWFYRGFPVGADPTPSILKGLGLTGNGSAAAPAKTDPATPPPATTPAPASTPQQTPPSDNKTPPAPPASGVTPTPPAPAPKQPGGK